MAADSFRSQMNSLGWSRRDEPINTTASSPFLNKLQSLNPFGTGGYVRLPTTSEPLPAQLPAQTRQEEEAGWLACESYFHQNSLDIHGCRSLVATSEVGMEQWRWNYHKMTAPAATAANTIHIRKKRNPLLIWIFLSPRDYSEPMGSFAGLCLL